jgi:hypothetical protein
MLGYKSPQEWAETEAPLSDVMEEDQQEVIKVYMSASEKMNAGWMEVRFKNVKTGKTVAANMLVVPIGYAGHIFNAHFLTKV